MENARHHQRNDNNKKSDQLNLKLDELLHDITQSIKLERVNINKSHDADKLGILKRLKDFNPKTKYTQPRVDYFTNGTTLSNTFKFNTGIDFQLTHICLYAPRKKKDKNKHLTNFDYIFSGLVFNYINKFIFLYRFHLNFSLYFLVFSFIKFFYRRIITLEGFLIWFLGSGPYCERWRSWMRYKSLMCNMILFIIAVRVDCPRRRYNNLHTPIVPVKKLNQYCLSTEMRNSVSLVLPWMFQEDFKSGDYIESCELAAFGGNYSKDVYYRILFDFSGKIAV
jgi:hypothetical protein